MIKIILPFILFMVFSIHSFEKKDLYYLYADKQYIGHISIFESEKNLEIIQTHLSNYFLNFEIKKEKKEAGIFFEIKDRDYFILNDNVMLAKIHFVDFPLESQNDFALRYCDIFDCDLVVKAKKFTQYSTRIHPRKIKTEKLNEVYIFDNIVQLKLEKGTARKYIHNITADLILDAEEATVIKFKHENSFDFLGATNMVQGSYLQKDNHHLMISQLTLTKDDMEKIIKQSNADCGILISEPDFVSCNYNDNDENFKDREKIILNFKNSLVEINDQSNFLKKNLKGLLGTLKPNSIQFSSTSLVVDNKESQRRNKDQSNLRVKYLNNNLLNIDIFFIHTPLNIQKKLHDFILSTHQLTRYDILKIEKEKEVLVSSHPISANSSFKKLSKFKYGRSDLDLALGLSSIVNSIAEETPFEYLRRENDSYISFTNLDLNYWWRKNNIGFNFEYKKYADEIVIENNTNEAEAVQKSVSLSKFAFQYRKMNLHHYLGEEIFIRIGLKTFNYGVNTNPTIGSLKFSEKFIGLKSFYHFQSFDLSVLSELGLIDSPKQDFSSSINIDSSSGLDITIGLEAMYHVNSKTQFEVGLTSSQKSLSLSGTAIPISDNILDFRLRYFFDF